MGNVMFMRKGEVHTAPVNGIPLSDLVEGQVVMIKENGIAVPFYLAKHNYESGLNGNGRTLLVRKDCYDTREMLSSSGYSAVLYTESTLDPWLNNEYKLLLDSTIQEAMSTTSFYCTTASGVGVLERPVFILSLTEFGVTQSGCEVEGSVLPIAETLRVAYLNGSTTIQLTRTVGKNWANAFASLNKSGNIYATSAGNTAGSRPCFTLPSVMLVESEPNADGSVNLKA